MSEYPPSQPGQPGRPEDPYGQEPEQPTAPQPSAPQPGGYQPPQGPPPQGPPSYGPAGDEPFYQGAAASAVGVAQSDAKGFFGALFDFSFTHYVTPKVVKIVYVIATLLILLFYVIGLIWAIVALFNDMFWPGLFYILFGWILAIIYLAIARITLEFYQAIVSVSEKVNLYARRDGIA
jgi:hypothetical protein